MLKREEIIEKLAAKGYTKKDAGVIITDVFEMITGLLAEGEEVQIHGFGTFSVKEGGSRDMIDYQTKKKFTLPSIRTPKFVAGISLKKAVREKRIPAEASSEV